jgi:hypothetical protein
MAANDQVQKYYDALINSYDILVSAVEKASERGANVTRQFVADITKGQREALELGKKLAGEPTDLGQYYTAVLEATTAAQGRALAFAQAAYTEALGAGSDSREVMEKLVAANRETAQAAVAAFRNFTASNPMADAIRRNIESFAPQAAQPAKAAKAEKVTA